MHSLRKGPIALPEFFSENRCRPFPDLTSTGISQYIFQMPRNERDERAEWRLLELIKQRDELKVSLRFAPPHKLAEGQALLRSFEAGIEEYEASVADVQQLASKAEAALVKRRQGILDMLVTLDKLEKEPTFPPAALVKLKDARREALIFLQADAEERGIPNDDH